ncbi:hypothetical protein [Aestuariirhabdus sp. LZHN29]|uniref:hypothetical protein n=1 Tax=Aestuariirhabdus sp. LZHN29 TaxID=3417462 RepID=UPI003CF09280
MIPVTARSMLGILLLLSAFGEIEAAQNDSDRWSIQLVTSSYLLRFYSYLGTDLHNYNGGDERGQELRRAETALTGLLRVGDHADLAVAWKQFIDAQAAFEASWLTHEAPDWESLQAMAVAHRSLLELLQRDFGGAPHFAMNLELLDLMEFYMLRSTDLRQLNNHPRGDEYDQAQETQQFEAAFMSLVDADRVTPGAEKRWRNIRPLLASRKPIPAPIMMIRHGGSLSYLLGEG